MIRTSAIGALLIALLGVPVRTSLADASPSDDVASLPLPTLSRDELAVVESLADRGPVLLTHFSNRASELPAIQFVVKVNAPAADVARIVSEPQHYPTFMPALESVRVTSSHARSTVYEWVWKLSIFNLSGKNVLTTYPPRSETAPYLIDVRNTGGDLGSGRMAWRVYPRAANSSLVVFASRVDMRDSNYITEKLASSGNSANRTLNISLAAVVVFGTKRFAETRAGTRAISAAVAPLAPTRPDIDLLPLRALLREVDLVLLETRGDNVDQVTVLGNMWTSAESVRRVLVDPEEFGRSILDGSTAKILARTPEGTRFRWGIDLPLIGVGGEMVLREGEVVSVFGRSGSFEKSEWHFAVDAPAHQSAVVMGWARFDPADSTALVRRLIAGNPDFSTGLSAALPVMLIRSLRGRIHIANAEARAKVPVTHERSRTKPLVPSGVPSGAAPGQPR